MAEKGAQPGNQNATKQQREVTNALRRAATQSPDKLKKACESVLDKAAKGDLAAFNVLADRLDGKAVQALDVTVTEMTHEEALDLLEHGSISPEHHTTH